MRVLMDLRPLRESAEFRRLWIGSVLTIVGTTMTTFAVTLQVWTITGSTLAVGGIGLVTAVANLAFGLVGGSLADAFDRRRVALLATVGQAAFSIALAAQAIAGLDRLWLLYVLVGGGSALTALSAPARRTFLAALLPTERIPAGAALNNLAAQAGVTAGPALAGVLAAAGGVELCYLVDVASFLAALYTTVRLRPMPAEPGAVRPGPRAIAAGLRLLGRNRILSGALLADLSATVLGMPFALLPAVNADRFGGDARSLGLLTSAVAVGGIVGSVLSGPVGHVRRPGRGMLLAAGVWGLGLIGFGLADHLAVAFALLAVAGAGDVIAVVFRTSIVQTVTPNEYRGRISAVEWMVGAGCPQLGNFRAGVVGSATSPGFGVVSGGVGVLVGATLIGLLLPAFTRYQTRPR